MDLITLNYRIPLMPQLLRTQNGPHMLPQTFIFLRTLPTFHFTKLYSNPNNCQELLVVAPIRAHSTL
jgi:hypothetical protein